MIPVPEEHDHDHVHDHDHPAEKSKGNEPEEETEDYVTLVSHGSDELRGGLEFKFFVHHAQFFLEVLGPGLTTKKSLRLAQADEGEELPEEIVLYMDVHNNESPAHFVIWSPTFDSSLKADCSNCSNVNALLNSGNLFLFPWNFPEYSESATRGGGLFWGFQATSEMIVKDSGVQDPIVPH